MKSKLVSAWILAVLWIMQSERSFASERDLARLLAKYQTEDPINWQDNFKADYERALQVKRKHPPPFKMPKQKRRSRRPVPRS